MADERDQNQFDDIKGKDEQQAAGQQVSEPGSQQTMSGQDSSRQEGEGTFGGQSSSGQAQDGGASETLTPDRTDHDSTGQSGSQDEGFIGSQGDDADTGGTDFASQGQGAIEDDEDKDSDPSGSDV